MATVIQPEHLGGSTVWLRFARRYVQGRIQTVVSVDIAGRWYTLGKWPSMVVPKKALRDVLVQTLRQQGVEVTTKEV